MKQSSCKYQALPEITQELSKVQNATLLACSYEADFLLCQILTCAYLLLKAKAPASLLRGGQVIVSKHPDTQKFYPGDEFMSSRGSDSCPTWKVGFSRDQGLRPGVCFPCETLTRVAFLTLWPFLNVARLVHMSWKSVTILYWDKSEKYPLRPAGLFCSQCLNFCLSKSWY